MVLSTFWKSIYIYKVFKKKYINNNFCRRKSLFGKNHAIVFYFLLLTMNLLYLKIFSIIYFVDLFRGFIL